MNLLLGVLFLLVVVSLVGISIYYIFIVSRRETNEVKNLKRAKPQSGGEQKNRSKSLDKKLPRPASRKAINKTGASGYSQNKIDFPDNIPRTIGAIRIIAKEDPDTVVKIIKKWLK